MTIRTGRTRDGGLWMASGTLHERMATPAYDESQSTYAKERSQHQAIMVALAESPSGAVVTSDGLIAERTADGGYTLSSPNSPRHKLAQLAAEEAAQIAEAKARLGIT